MRRFFVNPSEITNSKAIITGSEARHLVSVLRLNIGARVQLFDGTGATYQAEVSGISKGRVELIISLRDEPVQMTTNLFLGQALLKGKKMDVVIQKTTELGIAGLYPFISDFSNNRHLAAARESRRLERWRKISREACKQCNRPQPPECYPVVFFDKFLEEVSTADFDRKLIFWEEEKAQGLQEIIKEGGSGSTMILIGPEGGFSTVEVEKAKAAGFQPVTLGKKILRAETAAIAAVSILQYLLGNLG